MSIRIEHEMRDMEKLMGLLFSNTDEPLVKFTPTGLEARNMDRARVTLYELKAPLGWFMGYDVEKEVFGYLRNSKGVKATLRTLKAAEVARPTITRKDDKILLNETVIGKVDETVEKFEAPELKIKLPNRIALGTTRGFTRWLVGARKAGADNIGIACTEPGAIPTVRAVETVALKAFNEEVQFEYTPAAVEIEEPKFGSAYRMPHIEQFLPPPVALWKPHPYLDLLGAHYYHMPMGLNLEYGMLKFRAYVAPNIEGGERFLRSVGLLKTLTKEDVLREVKRYWFLKEMAAEKWEIERELEKQAFEIEKLEELLFQLVKEKKLVMRKRGWKKFYSLPEMPPKLKPLTEDVVLKTIRDMCEAVDTDAVGFSELEGYLAKEYSLLVVPLHDILLRLKKKELVESKPWPVRRPGGYAVDMRGYWAIKPTEPEEAVRQTKEAEVKPLPTDAEIEAKILERLKEEPSHREPLKIAIADEFDVAINREAFKTKVAVIADRMVKEGKLKIVEGRYALPPVIPPVPAGYARVRFTRDMVRFIGMDRKVYGPFKTHEEAVIEKPFADAFEKATYIEVLARAEGGHSLPEETPKLEGLKEMRAKSSLSPQYMPTRREIYDKALELFMKENPEAPTPEEYELKEGNFWLRARDKLLMTRAIPLSEWERYRAEIKGLAEELSVAEEIAEERVSREREKWAEEVEKLRGEIRKLKAPPGVPLEELPEDVRGYVQLLHVNVVAKPEKKPMPGFREPVWIIPVHDEGTSDVVKIVMGYPYTSLEKYRLIRITNKLARVITVLTPKEEAERVAVPSPKHEEVAEAIEAVEEEVPEVVVTAPVDWTWMRSVASRMKTWLASMEHQAEVRSALALYTYLRSINEWAEEAKKRLLAGSEFIRIHEARKVEPVYKILTDTEYADLWKLFSETLRKAKVDPAKYKHRFDDLTAWNMPYSDNELILMDEARGIILESKLKRYIRRLPVKPPAVFSWKHIRWGVGSLKIDVGVFEDAVKQENAVQSYTTLAKILNTAEKMKRLLEGAPEVRALHSEDT